MNQPINLPALHIFKLEEVQAVMLQEALRRNGIADPQAYVESNAVQFIAAFRLDANVMALSIVGSAPLAPAKELDSATSLPVAK